ncbi:hypothetical protein BC939DRAFT_444268 [Gamsiella multidivaricata]|uniref:uncharacterized protein n=1 Tax=Gamsiella multidivaricata TaxID=101098 RepID=UPI002221278A|nr:uncharacterized protein BC939DRAFT_444268 [Gamsiella multidivaricata]KAG0368862.1 hypothetical protein BGZ54_001002 [Gamsiella multidivaricata]KAI7828000.1 hypothetical protein BC939DRAFT_444268 [Gamsiella multidivaricata]
MVPPRFPATALTNQLQQRFVSLWLARSALPHKTSPCGITATRSSQPYRSNFDRSQPTRIRLFSHSSTATSESSHHATTNATTATTSILTPEAAAVSGEVSEAITKVKKPSKRQKPDWTPEADALLLELRTVQNRKWLEIGQQLGREPATCMTRFESTLNPTLKDFWTSERDQELDALVTAAKSWAEIAQIMGVHRLACMERWRQMGLEGLAAAAVPSSQSQDDKAALRQRRKKQRQQRQEQEFQIEQQRTNAQEQLQSVREMASNLRLVQQVDKDYDRLSWNSLLRNEQRYSHYRSWKKKVKLDAFSQLYLMNPGWSAKEEAVLIQFVLKHGLDKWDVVARQGLKSRFTPEQCRICWKNLDMPVVTSINNSDNSSQHLQREGTSDSNNGPESSSSPASSSLSSSIPSPSSSLTDKVFDYEEKSGPSFSDDNDSNAVTDAVLSENVQANAGTHAAGTTKVAKSQAFVWDKELSVRLQAVVRQAYKSRAIHLDEINWLWVSRRVHPNATSRVCKNHWKYLHDNSSQVVWKHEDIKKLEEGVRLLGPKKLTAIRDHFLPHMTKDDIIRHWFRISDKATILDEEEYYRLLRAVKDTIGDTEGMQGGHEGAEHLQNHQWTEIEKIMGPGWKKMPCKRVWESSFQYLIRHTNWTPNEDKMLLRMVTFVGRDDWYSVAKAMQSGKSPWQYRLRWCQLLDPIDLDMSDLLVNGEKYY